MKLACVCLAALLPGLLSAKEKTPPKDPGEIVTLDAYRVSGKAIGNFCIAIRILHNAEHKKTKLFIIDVSEHSDAEKLGLQVGDEIVKIGGVPVEDMDPRVTKDSPLGKIFLNRTPGDTVDLEVVTRRTKQVTLRAT